MTKIDISLLHNLVKESAKRRKSIIALKNAAVIAQQFELAAKIREIEKESFPETKEVKSAKETAKRLNLLFRMVDLNISEDTCWLILNTIKSFEQKKGKFSVEDGIKLRLRQEEIFMTNLSQNE